MKAVKDLEAYLLKSTKDLPALPKGFKDFLVTIAPWLTLIGGIFSIWGAFGIYKWATSPLSEFARELDRVYGTNMTSNGWSLWLTISAVILLVMGVIYLLAFQPLRNRQKRGWDLLFYALLINIVYGVFISFTSYGSAGNLFGALIGTLIGVYILFQLRDYYIGKAKVEGETSSSNSSSSSTTKKKPASKKKSSN